MAKIDFHSICKRNVFMYVDKTYPEIVSFNALLIVSVALLLYRTFYCLISTSIQICMYAHI